MNGEKSFGDKVRRMAKDLGEEHRCRNTGEGMSLGDRVLGAKVRPRQMDREVSRAWRMLWR